MERRSCDRRRVDLPAPAASAAAEVEVAGAEAVAAEDAPAKAAAWRVALPAWSTESVTG